MGVASLTKGPLGLLLPAMVLGFDALLAREWRRLLPLAICSAGGSLFFFGWALAFSERSGSEGLIYFLTRQNLDRFRGGRSHDQPFYYYLGTLWKDLAPWALLVVPAWLDGWRRARRGDRSARLLLCWFGAGLLFFSAAASKRSVYLLPILPAAGVLLARYIAGQIESANSPGRWARAQLALAAASLTIAGLAMAGLIQWLVERECLSTLHIATIGITTATLLGCGAALWRLVRSNSLAQAWPRRSPSRSSRTSPSMPCSSPASTSPCRPGPTLAGSRSRHGRAARSRARLLRQGPPRRAQGDDRPRVLRPLHRPRPQRNGGDRRLPLPASLPAVTLVQERRRRQLREAHAARAVHRAPDADRRRRIRGRQQCGLEPNSPLASEAILRAVVDSSHERQCPRTVNIVHTESVKALGGQSLRLSPRRAGSRGPARVHDRRPRRSVFHRERAAATPRFSSFRFHAGGNADLARPGPRTPRSWPSGSAAALGLRAPAERAALLARALQLVHSEHPLEVVDQPLRQGLRASAEGETRAVPHPPPAAEGHPPVRGPVASPGR